MAVTSVPVHGISESIQIVSLISRISAAEAADYFYQDFFKRDQKDTGVAAAEILACQNSRHSDFCTMYDFGAEDVQAERKIPLGTVFSLEGSRSSSTDIALLSRGSAHATRSDCGARAL
jgi:hypothetical protein